MAAAGANGDGNAAAAKVQSESSGQLELWLPGAQEKESDSAESE